MLRVAAPTVSAHQATPTAQSAAEQRVRRIWRTADAVCFDVDSTVCEDEAIDELAAYLGVGDAVAEVTAAAMNGNARFRHALAARLDVMKPTRTQLESYCQLPPKLTPGIVELVSALQSKGTQVYLVSGGFRRIIYSVADALKVPRQHIYANEILFDQAGNYAGFDENEPTSDSGSKDVGKPAVMTLLKKRHGYKQLVMVGDGATDVEASPPADAFVGFGGNQVRDSVRSRADWYVMDFDTLRKELQ